MTISRNKRRYFFQAVAYAHITSLLPLQTIGDNERTAAQRFSFSFLSAAAKRVTPDDSFCNTFHALSLSEKQEMQTARATRAVDATSTALQTARDLQFLVSIFQSQGEHEAVLSILSDDTRTGLGSAMAAGSWQLMVEKVNVLEVCKRWEELWRTCHAVLLDAALDQSRSTDNPTYSYGLLGDDYSIWRGLAVAAANLGTEETRRQTRHAFSSLTTLNARNRFLGQVQFYLHPANHASDKTDLISSLFGYQNAFRLTPSNFRDVSHFIARVGAKEKRKFVLEAAKQARGIAPDANNDSEATTIRWIRSELNSLKLDYKMVVSKKSNLSHKAALESFAANCLRLYKISLQVEQDLPITERRCGDDAAILAAMVCIHLSYANQSHAILQCAIILETLLHYSKHNFDGIALLVRVYISLGAISRAFKLYERLDIKNIQTQTLSWMLLSRISTLHPHASKKLRFDPGTLIGDYLMWTSQLAEKFPKIAQKHLDGDDGLGLFEAVSLSNMLQSSNTRLILMADLWRINWWQGKSVEFSVEDAQAFADPIWSDIRDSAALPNYEHYGQPTIDQYARAGPIPSRVWIMLQKCLNVIRWGLQGSSQNTTFDAIVEQWSCTSAYEDYFHDFREATRSCNSEFTDSEYLMASLGCALVNAMTAMGNAYNLSLCTAKKTIQKPEQGVLLIAAAEESVMKAIHTFESFASFDGYWSEISEQPRSYFQKMGWEFFHDYYLEAEQAYLHSTFVQIVLIFSVQVKDFVAKLPSGMEQPRYIGDPQSWIDIHKEISRRATEMRFTQREVVRRLLGIYRGNESVQDMMAGILGKGHADGASEFMAAINSCCDEGTVKEHCRSLADSFVDSLDGILDSL